MTLQLNAKPPCRCGDDSSPGNSHTPTRVKSHGDDGPVRQANVASSDVAAQNWNAEKQKGRQIQPAPCVCKADGIQALGQLSENEQLSAALGATLQLAGGGHERHEPRKGKVMPA